MRKFFSAVENHLWAKVMGALLPVVLLVIGLIIFNNVRAQTRILNRQAEHSAEQMVTAIEGGMFDSLAIGNNDDVRTQFKRLKAQVTDLQVHIFDFNGHIAFATDAGHTGRNIAAVSHSQPAVDAIGAMLATGGAPQQAFAESIEGKPYLSIYRPIKNEPRCFHCHGRSREILGGIHVRTSTKNTLLAAQNLRNQSVLVGSIGALAFCVIVYFLFFKLVNRPIRQVLAVAGKMRQGDLTHNIEVQGRDEISHMSARLNRVNENLRQMISEMVAASHTVATSASQQAGAVQQTSAALEELASMAGRNKDHAAEADQLMHLAIEQVNSAAHSMQQLSGAMNEMSRSSNQIARIVDTIDEIAFQTNLLALNAAVEAARAGEAGAGFSVVAEEVRSLAMRAAEAARETAGLIDQTVDKIRDGNALVGDTTAAFDKLVSSANQVAAFVNEIAGASQEQNTGIRQITSAIHDIDRGTQQNAATAQQLASSAGSFKVS